MRVYASLDTLVPQGAYGEIADVLLECYGGLAQGAGLSLPEDPARDEDLAAVVRRLEEGCGRAGCDHAR